MSKKEADGDVVNEDLSLFRQAMKDVTPIKKQNRVLLKKKKPRIKINPAIVDEPLPSILIFDYETEETVSSDTQMFFARPGLSQKQIRDLKLGKFAIEATLDLHGFNIETARDELIKFIDNKYNNNQRHIRIVHGKGHGDKPVLKNKLNNWLRQIDQILAFSSANSRHGGVGALYVLLKSVKK